MFLTQWTLLRLVRNSAVVNDLSNISTNLTPIFAPCGVNSRKKEIAWDVFNSQKEKKEQWTLKSWRNLQFSQYRPHLRDWMQPLYKAGKHQQRHFSSKQIGAQEHPGGVFQPDANTLAECSSRILEILSNSQVFRWVSNLFSEENRCSEF